MKKNERTIDKQGIIKKEMREEIHEIENNSRKNMSFTIDFQERASADQQPKIFTRHNLYIDKHIQWNDDTQRSVCHKKWNPRVPLHMQRIV